MTSNADKLKQEFRTTLCRRARKDGCNCQPEVVLARDFPERTEYLIEHQHGCGIWKAAAQAIADRTNQPRKATS